MHLNLPSTVVFPTNAFVTLSLWRLVLMLAGVFKKDLFLADPLLVFSCSNSPLQVVSQSHRVSTHAADGSDALSTHSVLNCSGRSHSIQDIRQEVGRASRPSSVNTTAHLHSILCLLFGHRIWFGRRWRIGLDVFGKAYVYVAAANFWYT